LEGEVYPDKLKSALQEMTDRHEILRTEFLTVDGECVQKILPSVIADFEYNSESTQSDEEIYNEFVRPFDLSKAQNVRVKLVNKGEYHLLLIDMHHIVSDGMSMTTFTEELIALYNGKKLEPLTHQFKDYSEWMRSRDLSKQKEYWINEFSDEIPVLDMPLDYARPQVQSNKGASVGKIIDKKTSAEIRKLSEKTGATSYMIFLSALMIMLSKYSRQEDIVIGSPISGRTHKDTEKMLGMFVNTLAMRGRPEGNKKYLNFLEEVKASCLKAYENQEYPFEELVENVEVNRDISRNPLFDVLLVLQNTEEVQSEANNVMITGKDSDFTISKFDMTFNIGGNGKTYMVLLEYCTDLYTSETADLLLKHFVEIIKNISNYYNHSIIEIPMLLSSEKEEILSNFNDTEVVSDTKSIKEEFEAQAEINHNKTALVYGTDEITYAELNKLSNSIAHCLKELSVGSNDFVAVLADRSIEMICSILGIVKAGGAYVPIDPTYPIQRIDYILNDSKPKAILKYCINEDIELNTDIPVIDLTNKSVYEYDNSNLNLLSSENDLLYCIYTSGTTGNPKGVMLEQRTIVNLINTQRQTMSLDCFSKTVLATTICFDVASQEIFSTLLNGGTGYIITNDIKLNFTDFAELCSKYQVNTLFVTPSYFDSLSMDTDTINLILSSLKYVILAGEAFYINNNFLDNVLAKDVILYNHYGPTETHVVTYNSCKVGEMANNSINIGKPIFNTGILILDAQNSLCGLGVPGELCVIGAPLARGYCNLPELTAEKFVNNPFGEGRLYKTGDLARWLPNGEIEYLGRIDEQVKIRGFRIELGEIENKLRDIENVKDSAVIVRADSSGDKAIYAYYTSNIEVSLQQIRNKLAESLPEYMIPSYIMQIESIPLTKNGKLDKRALPEIKLIIENEYVAPRNELEKIICEAYGKIFNQENVSIYDDFFALGGNSIKALKLLMNIKQTGVECDYQDIYFSRTPAKFAEIITNKQEINTNIILDDSTDKVELAEIVEQLYNEYDKNFDNSSLVHRYKMFNYGQSFIDQTGNICTVTVNIENHNVEQVVNALKQLVDEQSIFLNCYSSSSKEMLQYEKRDWHIPVHYGAIGRGYFSRELEKRMRAMPDRALLSFIVVQIIDDDNISVCCVMHHGISENYSLELFRRRIFDILNGESGTKNDYHFYDYATEMLQYENDEFIKDYSASKFYSDFIQLSKSQRELAENNRKINIYVVTKKYDSDEMKSYYERPIEKILSVLNEAIDMTYLSQNGDKLAVSNLINHRNEFNRNTMGFFLDSEPIIYDIKTGKIEKMTGFDENALYSTLIGDKEGYGSIPLNYLIMGIDTIKQEKISVLENVDLFMDYAFRVSLFTNGIQFEIPVIGKETSLEKLSEYFSIDKIEYLKDE
ncbi:MAG: amino acid adenylation domain-containing protein, partial [Ruminococcus sp.]|nr:amino acid adenylation domain-containing protein [Ruminococcus sp.]